MTDQIGKSNRYDEFFKAYDVRGKIPEIDERLFYLVGKGLVEKILLPQNLPLQVNIAYDVREKSEMFSRYMVQGIMDAGGSVKFIGLASTEILYAACVMDGNPGVQITASHNPREYHGLKIVRKAPEMVGMESGLAEIRDYVNEHIEDAIPNLTELVGVDQSGRQAVKEFLLKKVEEVGSTELVNSYLNETGRKIKIAVDCGNGAASVFMPWLEEMYPHVEFIKLFWEPDGTFPNHPANPQDYENLKDLQAAIAEHQADFGVAFDGDGDRAALVDENGVPVKGDFLVSAFTEAYLDEYKVNAEWQKEYNPVIASIQPNSRCVWATIGEKDGVGVICKQGHTFVKDAMAKYKGLYGGEYSNHHYFGQLKGMDSGAMPLALFLKLYVTGEYEKASRMFDKWSKQYFITELINIDVPAGAHWEDWKKKLEVAFADGTQSEFDGFAVYYPDWKFSMRPSNTEPVVRFVLETINADNTAEKVKHIESVLGI